MIKKVEVYGAGCETCKKLYNNAKQAVSELNIDSEVLYFNDVKSMFEKGIMHAPAIVIDNSVASSGTLLDVNQIKKLLLK